MILRSVSTTIKISALLTFLGGMTSMILGILVAVGWHTHQIALVQIHPSFVPMQYNTALSFILGGCGLMLLHWNHLRAAKLAALGPMVVGGLTLVEYLSGMDLGIDQLFMNHYILVQTISPGRMAPNTALCFILAGAGILTSCNNEHAHGKNSLSAIFGALVFALSVVALLGYPFKFEAAFGWGSLTRMALHTAMGFVVLGISLISLAWNREPRKDTLFPHWFPALIGIGTATATLALWQAYHAVQSNPSVINDVVPALQAHNALLVFGLILSVVLALTFHFYQMAHQRAVRLQHEQTALITSEQKFMRLFMEVSIPLCYVNQDGILLHINQRFTKLLGYTQQDVPNLEAWWPRAYPDPHYRTWVMETWNAAVLNSIKEGVDITPLEYQVTCKRGETKTLLIGGVTFGDDLLATLVDVTDRKEAEEKVLSEQLFSESIIKSLPGLFYMFDLRGNLVRFNRNFEEVSGYPRASLPGMHALEFIADEDRELVKEQIGLVFLHGYAVADACLLTRAGERIPYLFSGTRIEISGNHYLLGVGIDMTERKRLEAQLRDATLNADAANRAKSRFLATMSHEIRTPLNTIIGLGETLAETAVSQEQKNYLSVMNRASEGLLALINDILDLSKIEAGEMALEATVFDLPELIRSTCNLATIQARDKELHLNQTIDDDVPAMVVGDPQRLRQILLNLVNNAIKFTQCGTVELRVSRADSEQFVFSITDTGMGIAPENLERIFQPFTQADNSVTRQYGGTGLGLTICRQLVEAMGGVLQVESMPGQGSTFFFAIPLKTVTFPVEDVTVATGRASVLDPAAQTFATDKVFRILLAEDTEENQLVISAFLPQNRYQVEIASNGAQAYEMFRIGHYDAVLMDVQMPIMDGYTTTEKIRAWERESGLHRTPIMALTANAMREDTQRVLEAGCDLHLTKPIRKKRLLEALNLMLGENHTPQQGIDP